jgi:hypothetical protein
MSVKVSYFFKGTPRVFKARQALLDSAQASTNRKTVDEPVNQWSWWFSNWRVLYVLMLSLTGRRSVVS